MRWSALFDDLEAQAESAHRRELEDEVRDRTRREVARLSTGDRLRAAAGRTLQVDVSGAGTLHGRLRSCGPDWLLLEDGPSELLVPLDAVLGLTGLSRSAAAPGGEGEVARRLDLRWALRGLARDRAALRVRLRDGRALSGTLDRVGADHVDLAEHPPGELRRAAAVTAFRLVPLSALAVLHAG